MPIGPGGLGYLLGPLVAFAVLVLLGLFMRWTFGTGQARRRRRRPDAADDGLLTRIATLSRQESAPALRAVLSDAGIRSTVRYPDAGRAVVLVFPEDAARARALASGFAGPPQNWARHRAGAQSGRLIRSMRAPRPRSCSTKSG